MWRIWNIKTGPMRMLFTLQRVESFEVSGSAGTLKREQHTLKILIWVAGMAHGFSNRSQGQKEGALTRLLQRRGVVLFIQIIWDGTMPGSERRTPPGFAEPEGGSVLFGKSEGNGSTGHGHFALLPGAPFQRFRHQAEFGV